MEKRKHRMQGAVFWGMLGIAACSGCPTPAAAAQEISYLVRFVDAEDENTAIFNTQRGTVPQGTSLQISFPEQIVGSDGHIWNSLAESPQEFPVVQNGVQKISIQYQQGEKVKELEEAEEDGVQTLEMWLSRAWKADCVITGQDPEGMRDPYLVGEDQQAQDQRIKGLVSQISDGDWHTFYLIGKNHVPQTVSLGVNFDAVYSSSREARFTLGEDWYQVVRIRVKRNWAPEACTHRWELKAQVQSGCLVIGSQVWQCAQCGQEEEVRLPASGHQDPVDSGTCEKCGIVLDEEALEAAGEVIYWKEGEAQLRTLGDTTYRFVCVDEDYSDGQELHRTAALFLCDSVIPSDADSDSNVHRTFSFGENNNYKASFVRTWLQEKSGGMDFQTEPVSIGVCSAYTGSTAAGSFRQLAESDLERHEIGYQWMTDRVFLLSLEEALRYREVLWCFGTGMAAVSGKADGQNMADGQKTLAEQNPESQVSAYSQGYYLRTPYYMEADDGIFTDGERIYGVDLVNGMIHPVETGSETYGLRPAFVLPQG